MLRLCLVVIMLAMVTVPLFAQDAPRVESRVVNRISWFPDKENVGISAYINEPDVLRGGFRMLAVGGITVRSQDRSRWIECMGGGLITRTGFDPVMDLRAQTHLKKFKDLVLWGEVLHLFKSDRTLLSTQVTKTFAKRFKLGVESDTWLQKSGHLNGFGPGVGVIFTAHVQLWVAYQEGIGSQRDILRTYLIINW